MNKYLLSLLFALGLCLNVNAQVLPENSCSMTEQFSCCQPHNFYVRGLVGVNVCFNHYINVGYIASGSFGYRFNYGIRLEGEYAFRKNGMTKCSSYMINGLYDIPLNFECYKLQPYLGFGLGRGVRGIHWNFYGYSWQLIAGFDYPLSSRIDLCAEYKYHCFRSRISNHSIGLGVVYKFGMALN
jgi:opacity protein-like surface antigen